MVEIRPYGSPSFDFNFNHKIIQVPIARNSATIQELWNAIGDAMADIRSMDDDEIATVSGKEPLGGGQFVGLTLSLINGWRVQFAPRAGPDFITVTVSGGNLVTEEADQAPAGGPAVGAADNPIAPAAYVTVTIAQSVSGVISDRQDIDNKYLMESHFYHPAVGESFYWDPINGDDSKDGLTPSTARKTFQSIHDDLVTSDAHDVVFAMDTFVGGNTHAVETLVISKRWVSLRGPGHGFEIVHPGGTDSTITVTVAGVEISGMEVKGPATGTNPTIHMQSGARDFLLERLHIEDGYDGILIDGIDQGTNRLREVFAYDNRRDGIRVVDARQFRLSKITAHDNLGNGLTITATVPTQMDSVVNEFRAYSNGGYGLDIDTPNVSSILIANPALAGNALGRFRDNGTETTFSDDSERLRQIHLESFGRWRIDKIAGTLTLYDDDGTTALQVFALLDDLGVQVTDGRNIYERVPV